MEILTATPKYIAPPLVSLDNAFFRPEAFKPFQAAPGEAFLSHNSCHLYVRNLELAQRLYNYGFVVSIEGINDKNTREWNETCKKASVSEAEMVAAAKEPFGGYFRCFLTLRSIRAALYHYLESFERGKRSPNSLRLRLRQLQKFCVLASRKDIFALFGYEQEGVERKTHETAAAPTKGKRKCACGCFLPEEKQRGVDIFKDLPYCYNCFTSKSKYIDRTN